MHQTAANIKTNRIYRIVALAIIAGLLNINTVRAGAADEMQSELQILRQTSKAFAAVAREAMPAVVFIHVEKTVVQPGRQAMPDPNDLLEQLFGLRQRRQPQPERRFRQHATGTGFIVTKDGYILTNNHIVGDADRIKVKLDDGRELDGELIGSDPSSEVAVIKIPGDDLPTLPIGNSDTIEIGEWVIAIGNPFGLSKTLTVGVVSAKGRSNIGITDYEDFIQTDAAINPGNSGGPLLNIDGEVIGINTAIFSQMGGSLGIGFAIPINMAVQIQHQLTASGKVTRGYLGILIQDLTPELAESFKAPNSRGVLVSDVVEDTAAARDGVRTGDIILELNGKSMENTGMFRNQIALTPPGTEIKLTILRDGKHKELTVTVGDQTDDDAPGISVSSLCEKLGLHVENLTPQWIQRFGYEDGSGVLVARVRPESPAAAAGIKPGNLIAAVNHREIGNVDEFQTALKQSAQSGMLLLLVREGRASRFIVIRINENKD